MLIKALCDFYDRLAEAGEVNEKGFSNVPVQYAVCLSPDGIITGITDIRRAVTVTDKKGKEKTEYESVTGRFPFREKSTSIKAYRIDHRGKYIFGLSYDPDSQTLSVTDKIANEKFKEKNLEFTEGMDDPTVNAFRNFLESFVPENETENPYILKSGKNLKDGGFCFVLEGFAGKPLHEAKCIVEKIREEAAKEDIPEDGAICAVSGKKGKIAQLHNSVKGILGQKAGTFVCVNSTAGESYGKTQGFTGNVSEESMTKYTEAFNYLTSHTDPLTRKFTNKAYIDSMTVIFFAADRNSQKEDELLRHFVFDDSNTSEVLEPQIKSVMNSIRMGCAVKSQEIETDDSADYYVAGFVPNSSRVCMKFCYRDSFGHIFENVLRHQRDIYMGESERPVTIQQLTAELTSPVSKEQASPPIIAALADSIFLGRKYPDSLLAAVVNRVKTDSDSEDNPRRKINSRRAGIIKACLNRNYKEEITVALDETRKDNAYLCGRLFAVLEKLQKAAQGDLNTSIKDSYFASACSKPSVVFPKLIMLAQNHLKKLDSEYYNRQMAGIIDLLEGSFPAALSVEEQGKFIIGYYHQYQSFFKKKDDAETEKK